MSTLTLATERPRRVRGRRSFRSRPFQLAVATALVLVTVSHSRAAMVERMSLDDVTREAALIVHGTVLEVRTGRDESGLPATWLTLAVTRTVKGPDTSRLTIKQYGVATPLPDGTITRVAGLPRYRVGEEVVLFLRATSRRGFTSPVGFGQGAYRVRHGANGALVHRDLAPDGRQDVDSFLAEVERLAHSAP